MKVSNNYWRLDYYVSRLVHRNVDGFFRKVDAYKIHSDDYNNKVAVLVDFTAVIDGDMSMCTFVHFVSPIYFLH